MQVELDKIEQKGCGFPRGSRGERKGSRKFGRISDDFGTWVVKWSRGEWKIIGSRLNTKVATSLQNRAMSIAVERGRMVEEVERYTDFRRFSERLAAIVGVDEAMKIVMWIKS